MSIAKYRKRPGVVEATRYVYPMVDDVAAFCPKVQLCLDFARTHDIEVFNEAEGSWLRVRSGDFVIRGVAGEFYPCTPDIFKATYEPAETWDTGSLDDLPSE